jgi:hypothetical protein
MALTQEYAGVSKYLQNRRFVQSNEANKYSEYVIRSLEEIVIAETWNLELWVQLIKLYSYWQDMKLKNYC